MKWSKLILLFVVATVALAACAPKAASSSSVNMNMNMASMDGMPAEVLNSAQTVQAAYQFAAANPDVLKHIPCYCGCGAAGHTSNYSCYVKDAQGDKITYDLHATGCSICVDITQDAMRMMGEGKSVQDIRQAVDQKYAQYGPSNMP